MEIIIKILFYLFVVGLFFDRPENIIIFYITFVIYVSVSGIYNIRNIFSLKQLIILKRYFVFLLFATVSIFWSVEQELSKAMSIRLMLIFIMLFVTYYNHKKFNLNKLFIFSLCTGIFINLIIYLFFRDMGTDNLERFSGTLSNANLLSIVIIFSIFFYSLQLSDRKISSMLLFTGFIVVALLLIFATGSRKGLVLGVFMSLISVLSYTKDNKKFNLFMLYLIPFIVIYLLLEDVIQYIPAIDRLKDAIIYLQGGVGDSETKFRYLFIMDAYEVFKNNIICGVGIDAFQHFTVVGTYAHNNYLEILADLGLIGFILYYLIYIPLIKESFRRKNNLLFQGMIVTILVMEFAAVTYYMRFFWVFILFFYINLFQPYMHNSVNSQENKIFK